MKRVILSILMFVIPMIAFSDYTFYSSFGGQYSYSKENTSDDIDVITSTMESWGITFGGYIFWNDSNIGFFTQDSFFFPQNGTITTNGIAENVDYRDFRSIHGLEILLGVGFTNSIGNNLSILWGIGPSIRQIANEYLIYDSYDQIECSTVEWMFGIGLDLGIRYDIRNKYNLRLGTSLGYSLACHTTVRVEDEYNYRWGTNYSGFFIQPYLGIGMNTKKELITEKKYY